MSDSHSKGPWHLEFGHQQRDGGAIYWQVHDGADAIACNQFCWAGNVEANARLIAAAPELVEALQEARTQISLLQSMRGIVDTGHGTLSIIDAALQKAGVKVEMEDAGQ
ncbi:hypothetical protein ELG76_04015 [Rhizobium leguminosarum]|uniref:hypothetical protein n=1 Tax=Rhizobium leguminosarum TaxID=384 RepID=UPI0010314CAF|nr:hypothetical protein [Rhizobium leguminosarum]TBG78587.1 hypothetical protein ELG76_04015 [Rhizobium leguminosarum]